MNTIAIELRSAVDAAAEQLNAVPEDAARLRPAPGKWSKQEIIGHLIDSAANNHQRFVRAQEGSELVFPKYEQDHWVSAQRYNEAPWSELVALWRLYNHHLARVIETIPKDRLKVLCFIGPYEPVTLGFVVEDYLAHLKHHLRQAGI